MANKKKGKNSNYKISFDKQEIADKRKNRIILIVGLLVIALFVGGIVVAMIASSNNSDDSGESKAPDRTPYGIHYVEMDFGDFGKVVIKVDGDKAPITAKNFMELVEDGFYDGLTIFRAQENFVIQGGKNEKANLKPIVGEFSSNGYTNNISHLRGVISMARSENPDSATSQFFITLADSAKYSLDGKYAAFGYVVEGMDVVDAIAEALMACYSDSMGFVMDSDAIKIVSIKKIDYQK